MTKTKVAEPDYDFKLEEITGATLKDRLQFSNEVLIIKCTHGSATISINSSEHEFLSGTNFLLSEGMIFSVTQATDDFKLLILRFSMHFFNAIYPMIDAKVVAAMEQSAPDRYSGEVAEATDMIFRLLCYLNRNVDFVYRHRMSVYYVINYLLQIYEVSNDLLNSVVRTPPSHRKFYIDRFFKLCSAEHNNHRNIEYYASRLNITSRYLYKICKENIQMTPKQCIDYMVAGDAKKLLLTTVLNNQQIADELNFADQSTFGQFFRRNVGMTPSEFRNKFK